MKTRISNNITVVKEDIIENKALIKKTVEEKNLKLLK